MKGNKFLSLLLSLLFVFSLSAPVSAYAEASYSYGVDVSENNGDVDFYALKAQGCQFVMIRLGYYNYLDKYFYTNVQNAVAAGLNFGVYLYSYAFSSEEALIEAQFAVNTLSSLDPALKANMTLPVAYDIEDGKILSSGLGKNEITANAMLFSSFVAQNGYEPMIYANLDWFTNYIDAAALAQNQIKLWYANYSATPMTQGSGAIGATGAFAYMWQYSESPIDQNYIILNEVYDASQFDVQLSYSSTVYDGNAKSPSVAVYDLNGALVPTGYYSVSYENNIKIGTASVTVTFSRAYSSSITKSFKIKPKKPSVKSLKAAAKKQLTVNWKKDSSVTGYQVQLATDKKFKKNKKTVTVKKKKTVKTTVKKLKSKKKYYVRMRSYKTVNGKKYYSDWSSVKSIKVK